MTKISKLEKQDKQSYSDRINRIRGQVNGIARMLEEDRECMDIVQQVIAVRSALTSVGQEILKKEALECTNRNDVENFNKIVEKLFKLN